MVVITRGVLVLLTAAKAAAFTAPFSRSHQVARPLLLAATSTDGSSAALLVKLERLEKELKDIKTALNTASPAVTDAPAVTAMNAAYVARGRQALESRWGAEELARVEAVPPANVNAAYLKRIPAAVSARWGAEEVEKVVGTSKNPEATVASASSSATVDISAADAMTAAAKLINSYFSPLPRKVENVVNKAYIARNPVAVAARWGLEESGHISGNAAAVASVASVAVEQGRTSEAQRINAFFKPSSAKSATAATGPRVNAAYAARNPAAVAARWGSDGAGSTMTKDESGGRKNANAAYLARNPVAVAARWGSEETQKVGASAAAGGAGGASGAAPTSDALAQMAALEAQNKQLEKKLAQYEVALEALLIKTNADKTEVATGHGAEIASLTAQLKQLSEK